MEMSHHGGAEAESLLRTEKNAVVMPGQKRWDVNEGEKAPFLRNEPVKLTPAWEGANLPDDTLNLKGIGMELAPPKDKGSLIFLTLMLHGLGTLTAWNMFINANDYFIKYKLVNTVYANDFLTYVGWASQVPNLMFSWFNIFVKIGGDLTTRIVWSLVIEVLIFVLTVILAMVDTTNVPDVFFWLTMITVFSLNGFNAVFQNSVFGVAARLPAKYTGAVVLGSNICGTLVTLLEWLTHAVTGGNHPRTAAIYYFIIGMFVLLVCLDTYFALPLNRFYRYHETLEKRTLRVNPALAVTNPGPAAPQRVPYCTILKQSAVQLYNIFIIFFVTLTVFPAVQSSVVPVTPGLFGDNFVRVTCFLTFNLMAMFGNITANLFQYPTRKWLWLFTTARLLFIPLFLVCNYHPKGDPRTLSVLIADDYAYWFLSALLGWTSGHGSSLGMMYVSGTVAPEHAATAGMIGGACLITGIVSGITLSKFCSTIVRLEIFK